MASTRASCVASRRAVARRLARARAFSESLSTPREYPVPIALTTPTLLAKIRGMATTRNLMTQEPDAELVAFMNDLRAAEVRNELRETTVEWGEDTRDRKST